MLCESEGQRDQGERRIDRTRRRIHRAATYIKIVETVHATVRVDDALPRIARHPYRPHVVPAATNETRPRLVVAQQPVVDLHAARSGAPHLRAEYLVEGPHRS